LHVLVYLGLYKEILRQMGLNECVEMVAESDEDVEQDEESDQEVIQYVITLAHLSDGRWVEIAVDYCELTAFANRQPDETQFDINYRSRFVLGEASTFINLLVPLEAAKVLGGCPYFSINTN